MSNGAVPKCFICGTLAVLEVTARESVRLRCKKCGTYWISETLSHTDKRYFGKDLVNLRGWVSSKNRSNEIPFLDSLIIEKVINSSLPSISRRLEYLLIDLKRSQHFLGSSVPYDSDYFLGISYSESEKELFELLQNLREKGYVEKESKGFNWRVTVKGFLAVEDFLNKAELNTKQAFVAMWFHNSMNEVYENGIAPAISVAGYEPFRVDQHPHNNKIDDEIIAQIRGSKFLVADMTGHRGGVYYEAGFAYGLGMPVILTCKKCCMDDLHFDIRQYNCIVWENPEQLKEALINRIKAVIV